MPNLQNHHTQAQSNLQFVETVSNQFPDWAITLRHQHSHGCARTARVHRI